MPRFVLIVLDGCGVGPAPDASEYGTTDPVSNTLGHVATSYGGLNLPSLGTLGIGNIIPIKGVQPNPHAPARWGTLTETNAGKDTLAGHWEMMGIGLPIPFPTFPHGIPSSVQILIHDLCGHYPICNTAMSGTDAIRVFGDEHVTTGSPICYTSADSVLQIAAHEDTFSLDTLYTLCERLRSQTDFGRIIARPFIGSHGLYSRTENRRDWTLYPTSPSLLDTLYNHNIPITLIGRTGELFPINDRTRVVNTRRNADHMRAVEAWLDLTSPHESAFCFANFEDFDMLYGHRNDVIGFAQALESLDTWTGEALLPRLTGRDVIGFGADHGNDPTTISTDHSRELTPFLCFGPGLTRFGAIEESATLGTWAASIAAYFGVPTPLPSVSAL